MACSWVAQTSDVKTIYIVTSGEYSSYGIRRVFSTRKLAEEWCGEYRNAGYEIEEYQIDEPFDPNENIDAFSTVTINDEGNYYGLTNEPQYYTTERGKDRPGGEVVTVFNNGKTIEVTSHCLDKGAAIKTAWEIRARLIALGRTKSGIYNYKTLELIESWDK